MVKAPCCFACLFFSVVVLFFIYLFIFFFDRFIMNLLKSNGLDTGHHLFGGGHLKTKTI